MEFIASEVRALRLQILLAFLAGTGLSTLLAGAQIGLPQVGEQTLSAWGSIGPTGNFGSADQPFVNGRIRSIQIQSIGGDFYIYVGASSGGLWRAQGSTGPVTQASTGPVWSTLGDHLPNPAVGAFAVHPNNPDDILVGTGDDARYGGAGMFHTTDAGQTWTQIGLPAGVNPVYFFQVFYLPGHPNVMLAASDAGLLRSENGPNGPWQVVLNGTITDLAIHPADASIQYACRKSAGVYKSTNGGIDWSLIVAPANFGNARIAISRSSPSNLAFVYESNSKIQGMMKSPDGGMMWTPITASPPVGLGEANHALSIAIRPNNPNEIYVGANELVVTHDGGANWQGLSKIIDKHQDHTRLYFNSVTGDDVLWICSDGGVYRYQISDSFSSSWQGDQFNGLSVALVSDMDAKRDLRVIALQDTGAAASIDGGANWKGYTCCDVTNVSITDDLLSPPSIDGTFWYTQDGKVFRQKFSENSGADISPSQGVFNNPAGHLVYDRLSNKVYTLPSAADSLISRLNIDQASWTNEVALPSVPIAISGSYLNGQTLFVWGDQPGILTVLRQNSGTWIKLRSSAIGTINNVTYNILPVFASTERAGESWAVLSSLSVLHTTDDWQSWTQVGSLPAEAINVSAIIATPFNSRQMFASTDTGVYWSQDGGITWQAFQTGLPRVRCTALRYLVDPTFHGNDKLIVATFGRGLYERIVPGPPLVYVDKRYTGPGYGTFEHPYSSFDAGLAATPVGGILALHGDVYPFSGVLTLNRQISINAYESSAQLSH